MPHNCPNSDRFPDERPKIVHFGSYFRSSDSRRIRRFRCNTCRHTFSTATFSPCFRQKLRRINEPLKRLLASGVSLRRAAWLLNAHRTTLARRLPFLGLRARHRQDQQLQRLRNLPQVHFDDLETFEHSKCKPLSVTLAVTPKRKILGLEVSSMPAKGPLAKLSRRRYGFRPDQRRQGLRTLLTRIRPAIATQAVFWSDENPHYPGPVREIFPKARHETVKGQRGGVTGQGELKRGGYDPLFPLNHTCAMLRANVNRLFRRTWCTTKKVESLAHHLAIYADFHNTVLTRS